MAIAENDADRFRRQAEVCRNESEKAHSLVDAASWLRLPEDFDKLAMSVTTPWRASLQTLSPPNFDAEHLLAAREASAREKLETFAAAGRFRGTDTSAFGA